MPVSVCFPYGIFPLGTWVTDEGGGSALRPAFDKLCYTWEPSGGL